LSLIILTSVSAFAFRPAHGTERAGDAANVRELQQYAKEATALHGEFLGLLETASDDERFNLYWAYDLLMGTWVQIEFLQTLLNSSIATTSPSDEAAFRTTLRGQAQFVLWELDQANAQLQENVAQVKRPAHVRINGAIRLLLSKVRNTASRVWIDQCARVPCASGP
jgi:hypothetical protein